MQIKPLKRFLIAAAGHMSSECERFESYLLYCDDTFSLMRFYVVGMCKSYLDLDTFMIFRIILRF